MIVFDQLKKNDPHLRLITWGVLLGMGVLFAGLWWVQIISYRHFAENQKAQSFRTVRIPAIRGKILDRHGTALAENQPSYNVILYLDDLREEFKKEWSRTRPQQRGARLALPQRRAMESQARYRVASNIVQHIATILQQPVPFSYGDFMKHYTNQLALPLPVLVNLNQQQVARLLESSVNPPGVDLEIQPTRHYPGGSLAAHVLGYLVRDNRSMEGEVADFNFRLPDYRGHVGIEGEFDGALRGKAGVKSVLVNSLGSASRRTSGPPPSRAETSSSPSMRRFSRWQRARYNPPSPASPRRAAQWSSWIHIAVMCSRWPPLPRSIPTRSFRASAATSGFD